VNSPLGLQLWLEDEKALEQRQEGMMLGLAGLDVKVLGHIHEFSTLSHFSWCARSVASTNEKVCQSRFLNLLGYKKCSGGS